MRSRLADPLLLGRAADRLADAREARLSGKASLALILEDQGQRTAELASPRLADSLLAAWEGSLASHPLALPEWQEACR